MSPFHDLFFWLAVAGAAVFRLLAYPLRPLKGAAAGVFGGVFSAIVFTDPLIAHFNVNPDVYKVPLAAILTLVGELVMRLIVDIARDPSKGVALLNAWRGKK